MFCNESKNTLQKCNAKCNENLFVAFLVTRCTEDSLLKIRLYICNTGNIIETIVYFELIRRGYPVFFGKWYDAEVDFLAVKQVEKKYFRVTYSLLDERVKERELGPLKAIKDSYEKNIISMDKSFVTDYQGIKIINIIDFLLS